MYISSLDAIRGFTCKACYINRFSKIGQQNQYAFSNIIIKSLVRRFFYYKVLEKYFLRNKAKYVIATNTTNAQGSMCLRTSKYNL